MVRRIRWDGDPSPWNDVSVVKNIAAERLPLETVERFRVFDRHQRICALPGNILVLGPEHGFSKQYQFGPEQFTVWMDDADARRLFDNEWDRWQFLDTTDIPWDAPRPRLTRDDWRTLLRSFAKLGENRRLLRHGKLQRVP